MGGDETQSIDLRDVTRELPRTVVRRRSRRMAVGILGVALVAAGLAFAVIPVFPGFPLILVGLALLATEFLWARRLQAKVKTRLRRRGRRSGPPR